MSIFSSTRERRLWLALAIVLAAIYATLGQAPAIVDALGASILDNVGSNLVFAIIALLVVIPVFFIDKRLGREAIALGAGILTVYLLAWLRHGALLPRIRGKIFHPRVRQSFAEMQSGCVSPKRCVH